MADCHSPTVVQPDIPAADMTPLERLILDLVESIAKAASTIIHVRSERRRHPVVDDLRTACAASRDHGESSIGEHVAGLLSRYDADASDDPPEDIDVDLSDPDVGWDRIFQDIVRRSATVDEIVVTTAFICTKMRPDGFGGSVVLITANAIHYRSTTDVLEEFWNEAAKAAAARQVPSSTDNR